MFFYGRIIIPLHSLFGKSRNSDFKMALSFAIIASIAANALEFINNARISENRNSIFERKKLINLHLV